MEAFPEGRHDEPDDQAERPMVLATALTVAFVMALVLTVGLAEPVANDANAWLAWAGQLADGSFPAFQTGPSWKPLPPLLVTPAALHSQSAAAFFWMACVRFSALAASVLLFSITNRRWGRFAGLVAAFMPLLIPDWATATITGLSEPIMVAAALGAVEAHLRGRSGVAIFLAVIACLVRPEAWVFFAAYAVFLIVRDGGRHLAAALMAMVAIIVGWFIPVFGAHGDALQAATRARDYRSENGGSLDFGVWLRSVPAKLWPLIPVGAVAAIRRTDRVTLVVTGAAVIWLCEVALLVATGYPNFSRFVLPAFVALSIPAGAGAGWINSFARNRWQEALVQGAIVLIAIWGLVGALDAARASWRQAGRILTNASAAQATLDAAGGAGWVRRCGPISTNGYPKYDRILSRRLGLPLESFTNQPAETTLHGSGVLTGPPAFTVQDGRMVAIHGSWTLTTRPRAGCG